MAEGGGVQGWRDGVPGSSPMSFPVMILVRGARARGEERRRFQREWNEEDVGLLIEVTGGAGKECASRIPEVGISSPWMEGFL